MKIPGVEFKCHACGAFSEDNEVCSICGADLPQDPDLDALFIPGYSKMTDEEKREAEEKARQMLRRSKHEP